MKKFKSIISLSILIFALLITYNIFSHIKNNQINIEGVVSENFMSRTDNQDTNTTLSKTSNTGSFVATHKYVKVFFDNTGAGNTSIFIQDKSGKLVTGGTLKVDAGKSGSMVLTLSDKKTYTFSSSTLNGATDVKGQLTIRSADILSQVN